MSRGFVYVAAIAVGIGVIAAGSGCAVMTSGQCTDKASCAADETSTDGAGFDAPLAPDVQAGVDATVDADAGLDDRRVADMSVTDAPIDAPPEVSQVDAADGCNSTGQEDCTNGVDDNCDGKIDCEDPLCQPAYACIPAIPTASGWLGPVEFWQAANPSTIPPCQRGYGGPVDLHGGTFNAQPAPCSCSCTATGQTCSPSGTFFSQTNCGGACATVVPMADGTCTPVPPNSCGSEGSFTLSGTPAPSGGTCAAGTISGTPPPVTWTASARVCPYTDTPPTGSGGCAGAGATCARSPIGDAGTYGSTACVYSLANPPPTACPAGYGRGPITVFKDNSDTRGCSPTCPCSGTPTGGSCSGTVSLFGNFPDAGCTGTGDTYTLATACQCYGQSQCGAADQVILNNVPGFVRANYTVTAGTCAQPPPPAATGMAAPTNPYTICCN